MGNFSRDTFELNKLKHYVGVRLQQGVPLVDADWNELEDIRKLELRAFLKWYVGDGVPLNNDGFAAVEATNSNTDFIIKGGDGTALGAGRLLADGWDVMNLNNLNYTSQPLYNNSALALDWGVAELPALTPNPGLEARQDLIYLDIWEREVDSQEDGSLINPLIGEETCVRLKREWVVRVEEGVAPPPNPTPADWRALLPTAPAGHVFYPLAGLNRPANATAINQADIADLRRKGLTALMEAVSIYGLNVGIGTTTPQAKLEVDGDLKVGTDVEVGGDLNVNGTASFAQTLSVTGQTNLGNVAASGTLSVSEHTTLSSAATSGNLTVAGDLAVGDQSTLSGTLSVAGNSILSGSLDVSEHTTLSSVTASGNLTVEGDLAVRGTDDTNGVLFTGVYNSTTTIPQQGAGTRMLWYPSKAAFRVGQVYGNQWDDTNIGDRSTATGYDTTASGSCSTAMGERTRASGWYSTALGFQTTADGYCAIAMGRETTASGWYSTAMGLSTTTKADYSLVLGVCGQIGVTSVTSTRLAVANGTQPPALSATADVDLVFKVDSSGKGYFDAGVDPGPADYAEYFETDDGAEIPAGYFVGFADKSEKIRKARAGEDILGIVSAAPGVVGDSSWSGWNGRYQRDEFGRYLEEEEEIEEEIEVEEEEDEPAAEPPREGEEGAEEDEETRRRRGMERRKRKKIKTGEKRIERRRKLNPEYDPSRPYTPRAERPEWVPVGLLGKLYVYAADDLDVGDYVTSDNDGRAVMAKHGERSWRVMEVKKEHKLVRVMFR